MYLNGEFGTHPDDVNPYAASTFYAVDRYAAWKKDWGGYYQAGGLVLSDRYTTSNAVHQTCKLPEAEWEGFIRWLFDFECGKLGLPLPDLVIYLDMPTDKAVEMLRSREKATHTRGISTRWTRSIWPSAAAPPMPPPGCWAGRGSPAWTAAAPSGPLRTSTGRYGIS